MRGRRIIIVPKQSRNIIIRERALLLAPSAQKEQSSMRLDILRERLEPSTDESEIVNRIIAMGDYEDTATLERAWELAQLETVRGDKTVDRIAHGAKRSPETIRLLIRLGKTFNAQVILAEENETLFELLNISHLTAVLPVAKAKGLHFAMVWLKAAAFGDAEAEAEGVNPVWTIRYLKRRIARQDNPDKPAPLSLDDAMIAESGVSGLWSIVIPRELLEEGGLQLGQQVKVSIRAAALETAK